MKISIVEYLKFREEYFKKMNKRMVRFGQAFVNKYLSDSESDNELFYCTDKLDAERIILLKYIKQ